METKDRTSGAETSAPWLVLNHLSKSYGPVQALMDFSMTVAPGEVIGIVGENGAGKSTLMKILGGVILPDSGSITVDGVAHAGFSVADSMGAGIAFVHQELNLFDNLDVAGNVLIGREKRQGGLLSLLDRRAQRDAVTPLLKRVGATFSADTPVANLSLAQCQMVEIAKALSMDARLVILDEPTSSLPMAETEKLLDVIADLKRAGIAVIFITHRLHEIERSADRVVALRDGRLAGGLPRAEITHDRMVKLMIGRDLKRDAAHGDRPVGAVVLSARGIRTPTRPTKAVDLDLHGGEILGLAGLVGAGRTELARVFFGVDRPLGGTITLNGQPARLRTTTDAVKAGIFLVPEDRKLNGVLLDLPISENISLPNLPAHARRGLVSRLLEMRTAETQRTNLAIKTKTLSNPARSLSGGNQQKVVLAKWLAMKPRVLIFDEPTRGIDIGAKAEIYRLMRELADSGVAILMISSDMEEVIGASDRIAVMHEGAISGYLSPAEFSEENVLLLAVGKKIQDNVAA
ncbi:sugar ABC transporter ATP-binding protein [Acidisoma cellulosilytica]|uniref:Sugar ABC transporter ATP-binding protein n=1 Tax=Acidisoma cellulosilyticum TaxID=2802395 RepID=A0A963YYI2_9PROT|nr:sugar ABC transporter ATP-binding protein [Acidisoma cellulosilyticum]MCB8879484.1 sugar ABC transporter ATP-binding protein [Acidisoma cellulosilyticum]